MSVTKIRKTSSWTLLAVTLISLLVLGIYYFGGVVDPAAEMVEPVYTGLLLNWIYAVFAVTIFSMVLFAIWNIVSLIQHDAKSAIMPIGIIAVAAAILVITFSMGDGNQLNLVGYDGDHNTESWLKLTDMWLYTTYILMGLILVSLAFFSVRKVLSK
ncbi:MAG: hypothetical protein PHH72_13440 [Parabacteroides sp.]|nr:hypothetical protein [Parabacteroides sp.]